MQSKYLLFFGEMAAILWGQLMMNCLTVSGLLKAVILITALCVIVGILAQRLGFLGAPAGHEPHGGVADASANLFKAMHNLRTDRPTPRGSLNAEQTIDRETEKYLRGLRQAQMPALARALELLPGIEFADKATLLPELDRLNKTAARAAGGIWNEVTKPKASAQRRPWQGIYGLDAGAARTLDKIPTRSRPTSTTRTPPSTSCW